MRPGAVVAERFEIERLAASGGMGSVFRAIDRAEGGPVALKILHPRSAHYEDRFEREARILSELHHPGIVRYVAHGVASGGERYLAIEWLDGEDLAERLTRERLSISGALTLLRRLAGALGAAHERGIVHRDVKPSNIFLPDGALESAKLLDFGIARVGFTAWEHGATFFHPDRSSTHTGVTLGTPGYMAPEQARGANSVDARADVFSLGCVIFNCLAGRAPFVGDHVMAILAKIVVEGAPRLSDLRPDVPPALADIVAWMLEKEPDGRPRDGNEVFTSAAHLHVAGEQDDRGADDPGETGRQRSRPEITAGEQRLLSVVLISGSLADAAALVPEDPPLSPRAAPADLTARADAGVRAVAASFGGHVEALADRAYLVTLLGGLEAGPAPPSRRGAPVQTRTATDQADQAARCALALRSSLPSDLFLALATGPGVASGRWPVGQVIDRAVALLRDEVREASAEARRGDVARPRRGIRIDEVTAGLLDARFEVVRRTAPGPSGPVDDAGATLWAERPHAGWVRTLLGKPTPCVGRERQLRVLASLYAACVSEPKSIAVVVKAPAGVGKSRLLREFLRALGDASGGRTQLVEAAPRGHDAGGEHDAGDEHDADDVARAHPEAPAARVAAAAIDLGGLPAPEVWLGCGDPMRSGSPFGLLAAAVRAAAAIQDGEPLPARRHKLRARVARSVPASEQARVTEFLGEMIGAPFSEEQSEQAVQLRAARSDTVLMGDQMRRAWEDLVAAECAQRPLIIVLEDLHWGDLPTVKYIDAVLRHAHDAPLMVLALARPEVAQQFPELWAGRNVMELRLGELSRKASEQLVREVLGPGVSAGVVERILDRASGNVLYLEELIRAVAAGHGEGFSDTVLAMAHARIDGLDPAARRVLRAASVFGEVFWRGGVAALLGGAQRAIDLDGWLPELVGRELIEQRGASRFPGEEEYAFRHALIREAAYATLTEGDRPLGHRLAGVWLEQIGELDVITLAEHFDRGGEPGRAVRWFLRGAEQALEGGDLTAAIACAERGARHRGGALAEGEGQANAGAGATTRSDETLGALRLLQAEAHRWRGEFEEAQRCAAQAARRLSRGTLLWFRAADELISASGRRGDYMLTTAWAKEIGAYGEPALPSEDGAVDDRSAPADAGDAERPAADPTSGSREDAPPSGVAADADPGEGDAPAAARGPSDIRSVQVIALCSAARQLFHAGQYGEADALIVTVGLLVGDLAAIEPRAAAEVYRLRGARARHIGDLADDLAGYAAALEAFERAGDVRNACNAQVSLGFAYIEIGDFEQAGETLEAALVAADRLGLHTVSTRARQNLGLVLAARGQLDEALAIERQVILESREQGNLRFEGGTRIYAALIQHRAGDFVAAEAEARGAAEILQVTPPARAGALAALARALTAQGRIREAVDVAGEAIDILIEFSGIEEFESLVLVAFIEAARAIGDFEGARLTVTAARDRLLYRAEALAEPAWRESFLHRVRENAMLLSLARVCLGESALPSLPDGPSDP